MGEILDQAVRALYPDAEAEHVKKKGFRPSRKPLDFLTLEGQGNPPASYNSKREEDEDEDEEGRKARKALKSLIDGVASGRITSKDAKDAIDGVYSTRAPTDEGGGPVGDWSGDSGTSTAQSETQQYGIISAKDRSRTTGWTNQNANSGSYRTTDPQEINFQTARPRRGSGASTGPASRGSAQSGLYPDSTYVTTFPTAQGQEPGDVHTDLSEDHDSGTFTPRKGKWDVGAPGTPELGGGSRSLGKSVDEEGFSTRTHRDSGFEKGNTEEKWLPFLLSALYRDSVTGATIDQEIERRVSTPMEQKSLRVSARDNVDPRYNALVNTRRKRPDN